MSEATIEPGRYKFLVPEAGLLEDYPPNSYIDEIRLIHDDEGKRVVVVVVEVFPEV